MADLNPEQERILQNLLESMDRLSTRSRSVSDSMEDQIKQALQDRTKKKLIQRGEIEDSAKVSRAMRRQEENSRAVSYAMDQMTSAVTKLTRSIYSAEAGQKKYAEAVDTVVTALGTLAFFMGGPMMKVLSTVVMGLSKFFRASVDMSDALFKNYQELSQFGAASGAGTQGVYSLMQSMRLSTEQLAQLTQIISANAQGLALFKGTVFSGAESLGDLRKEATRTGLELEAFGLGMTPQVLNERMAAFINQQAQLGAMDVRTTSAAVKSLREYIFETDRITKLTGASAQQQEDAMKRAMAVEQFRIKIAELERENTAESRAEAQRLSQTFKILSAVSPTVANAFAQATTGILGPEGVGAQLAAQGQIFEVANARGLSVGEGLDRIGKGLRTELGPGGIVSTLAQFGGLQQTLGLNIQELFNLGKLTEDQQKKILAANNAQELQAALQAAGVEAQVKTMQADLNSMAAMQNFVKIGVGPATTALAGLAQVVESLTSLLPKSGTQALGGLGGAAAGAAGGMAVAGPVGAVVGGVGGFLAGSSLFKNIGQGGGRGGRGTAGVGAGGAGAAGSINPDDVLQFRGGVTGNRENFDKLDAAFRDRLLAMAYEYKQMTGTKLMFGSGQRDQEQNAQVGGAQTSLHLQGRAADLSTDSVNYLKTKGLLDRYGFKQNPSSAWHISDTGFQTGGIATGPRSGYSATLHGTEAIVPLPDGKTIPVQMPNLDRNMEQQVGMLGAQLVALEEIVRAMRESNSISTRILQAANN